MSEIRAAMAGAPGRVARAIDALLPLHPTAQDLSWLHLGGLSGHYANRLQGARLEALYLQPIREIVGRGGKCWRSLLLEACCRAVGGDFTPFEPLLALPELIHVGSLIVDDVQDASSVRRGGPTCHVRHGPALAVNAGTGAYFLAERALDSVELDARRRDAIRTLMFDAFRAAHAGQALDIGGFDDLVSNVLAEREDPAILVEQVELVHWLKTAVPAAAFARVGCVLGEALGDPIEHVAAYVEAVGMGFQAIDDVLDLRGFAGGLKVRGEDIRQGKLTLPVALALQRLPTEAGRNLWSEIHGRPDDPEAVERIIATLEASGAVQATQQRAFDRVDTAWSRIGTTIQDPEAARLLHDLGQALLRRQY